MSRIDKQQHQELIMGTSQDTSVRLFAFANTRPHYHVVFAPESPLIILKSKQSAIPQHPCLQWEPLSTLIFEARPNTTHAVYVADTTHLSSIRMYEQEEVVNGAAVGPLLKRFSNTITRLNPHNATLAAAGVSCHLALKYVLVGEKTLGHRDRLVRRLVLICPSSLNTLKTLANAIIRRPAAEGYPLPEVVVLIEKEGDVDAWSNWLTTLRDTHARIASFRISTNLKPSLFAAIAREVGLLAADGTTVDIQQRYPTPRVYRLDFVLSKQTKSVEQLPRLSPLDTLGYDDDAAGDEIGYGHSHNRAHHHHQDADADGDEDGETPQVEGAVRGEDSRGSSHNDEAAATIDKNCVSCRGADGQECDGCHDHDAEAEDKASSVLVSGLNGLANWCHPMRVILEGRVLDWESGLMGTTDGCVVVKNLKEIIVADPTLGKWHARAMTTSLRSKKPKPPAIAVAAAITRDADGSTALYAEEVRPLTKAEVQQSMTARSSLEEIPMDYNASDVAHRYGAILIRGRKCAMVRDKLDRASTSMHIPATPHSSSEESCIECAVRALCDGCEVSSDNFYLPNYLPPVNYYVPANAETAVKPVCVTLYTALAISPPPRGAKSDAVEDAPEPEEPYDWVSFDCALTLLRTEAEREALREAQRHLQRAQAAGLYHPVKGCGLFGEAVRSRRDNVDHVTMAPPADVTETSCTYEWARRLAGLEYYVVVAPGGAAAELMPTITKTFHTGFSLVCDGDTTTAAIKAIGEEAQRQGEHHVLLFLGEDADAEAFCEAHLLELTETTQATAQVLTVLPPQSARSITGLEGDVQGSHIAEELLEVLLCAVRVSDALVTITAAEQLSWAEYGVLRVCSLANPDLVLFCGWEARHPFSVADCSPARWNGGLDLGDAATLHDFRVSIPAGVPVAPAALAYLTHAGALDCFYKEGESRLLGVGGSVWVPTRDTVKGVISLDVTSHCLVVEPGEEWVGLPLSERMSELTLLIWCADVAASAACATFAASLQSQLQWNEARDGVDWSAAHDPLPRWD